MSIVRLIRQKKAAPCGVDSFLGFGMVVRPCEDPDGVTLPDEIFHSIRMEGFTKVPGPLVSRWLDLCIYMMGQCGERKGGVDSSKEVSVVLLRDEETMTKWRMLVPRQEVGGASVEADFTKGLCDIETGEEVTEWPPPGWMHAGSSHSHNNMAAFFSATDDKSELPVPGLHFVVGNLSFDKKENLWTYRTAVSIVYHGKRYQKVAESSSAFHLMTHDDVIDMDAIGKEEYHEKVLDYVKVRSYTSSVVVVGSGSHLKHDDQEFDFSGYYGGYGLTAKEIERYRERQDREKRRGVGKGKETSLRKFMIPVTGLEWRDVMPDACVRVFNDYAQEVFGKPQLTIRLIYEDQVDETFWIPAWMGGKNGHTRYFKVEETYELAMDVAREQDEFRTLLASEGFTLESDPRPNENAESSVKEFSILREGGKVEIKASDFTEDEIIGLCGAWSRSLETRVALRLGHGMAMRAMRIPTDNEKDMDDEDKKRIASQSQGEGHKGGSQR